MHRDEPRDLGTGQDPLPSREPQSADSSPHAGDVTLILASIEQGQPQAAEQLLPLVYDELRKLATARMAQERPGQTLQATALVHEAYIRLVDTQKVQRWHSRGHFFAAAAEAMRRILVDHARRKNSLRQGGPYLQTALREVDIPVPGLGEEILTVDDALDKLAAVRPQAAVLVKLRLFAGLTTEEASLALGLPTRTTRRLWVFARAWLRRELDPAGDRDS